MGQIMSRIFTKQRALIGLVVIIFGIVITGIVVVFMNYHMFKYNEYLDANKKAIKVPPKSFVKSKSGEYQVVLATFDNDGAISMSIENYLGSITRYECQDDVWYYYDYNSGVYIKKYELSSKKHFFYREVIIEYTYESLNNGTCKIAE